MVQIKPKSLPPGAQQITITENNTTPVVCKCGNEIFMQGIKLRRVSPLLIPTPDGSPTFVPFDIYVCSECTRPLNTMLEDVPKEIDAPRAEDLENNVEQINQ